MSHEELAGDLGDACRKAGAVCILKWVPDGDTLKLVSNYGSDTFTKDSYKMQPAKGIGNLGKAWESNSPQFNRNCQRCSSSDCPRREEAMKLGIKGALWIPLEDGSILELFMKDELTPEYAEMMLDLLSKK
eukprot:CAMPEP_0117759932 /NCGR_PEP_ID=MMETSP0947-20121206/16300_1 /TAXON_ID=44440 /ORGANISM="Chattonella subsalsa, Strain CCMP2191" /LENGTH=130 /DNA_ID=CAMNT_0005580469 /DNA_START=171 /DNA_END=563 /DNA_ORIENTATION=-